MRSATCAVACLMVFAACEADAQTCAGAPSLRDKPMQGGLAAAFVGDRHDVGGAFTFGTPSLFGGVGLSATHISFLGTAPTFSALVGTEIPSSDNPVFTCPLFQVAYSTGPDFDPFDATTFGFRTGVSVGAIVVERRAMAVIPTFALAVLYDRGTVSFQDFEATNSVWSGVATFGAGFVFNRYLSVIPALEIPFSAGAAETGFSFRWIVGFGR
jgi:hypothetical protein